MTPSIVVQNTLSASSPVYGLSVVVEEFELPTEVARYDGPNEWFGIEAAQQIARGLQELGANAVVSASDVTVNGDVYVRGKLITVDGGSKTARLWAGFGAGAATFEVQGTVELANGEIIGQFTDKCRTGVGALDSTYLLEKCTQIVGQKVAKMIASGTYNQSRDKMH